MSTLTVTDNTGTRREVSDTFLVRQAMARVSGRNVSLAPSGGTPNVDTFDKNHAKDKPKYSLYAKRQSDESLQDYTARLELRRADSARKKAQYRDRIKRAVTQTAEATISIHRVDKDEAVNRAMAKDTLVWRDEHGKEHKVALKSVGVGIRNLVTQQLLARFNVPGSGFSPVAKAVGRKPVADKWIGNRYQPRYRAEIFNLMRAGLLKTADGESMAVAPKALIDPARDTVTEDRNSARFHFGDGAMAVHSTRAENMTAQPELVTPITDSGYTCKASPVPTTDLTKAIKLQRSIGYTAERPEVPLQSELKTNHDVRLALERLYEPHVYDYRLRTAVQSALDRRTVAMERRNGIYSETATNRIPTRWIDPCEIQFPCLGLARIARRPLRAPLASSL